MSVAHNHIQYIQWHISEFYSRITNHNKYSINILMFMAAIKIQFHLSGLTGTASHPDMQNIQIIGALFQK